MSHSTKPMRRDARANVERLRAAALEIFLEKGLGVPLEEIARKAGVSVGTLYNRFGSREALIDAVVPEVAAARLQALALDVHSRSTPRRRLEAFVDGMIDLQTSDAALNDAILRRFPDALTLRAVCDRSAALGAELVRAAHEDGSLPAAFTSDHLDALFWLAGQGSRAPRAAVRWREVLEHSMGAAWTNISNGALDPLSASRE